MPEPTRRNSSNAAGAWYVDDACIACGLCASLAPENFRMATDGSIAFVFKQPAAGQEEEDASSAMRDCPVEAIGNDG
jgi:ferredoxin